jgi:hypothetical protein
MEGVRADLEGHWMGASNNRVTRADGFLALAKAHDAEGV